MGEQETYELVMKVVGEDEVKKLKDALILAEAELKKSVAALGTVDAAALRADASVQVFSGQISDLKQQLERAENNLKSVGGSVKNLNQLFSSAGYAVDDLQYGFKGISNNIQPILQSIPALAGLAGPISAAAILVYQLYEHWDQLMNAFGMGATKTQAQEMEELAKNTHKTAEETERLAKWEERRKTIAAQQNDVPKAEAEQRAAAHDAIVEGPYNTVRQAVTKIDRPALEKAVPQNLQDDLDASKQMLDEAKKVFGPNHVVLPEIQKEIDAAQKKIDDWIEDQINGKVAGIEKDPKTRETFRKQIADNPMLLGGSGNTDKFLDATKTPEQAEAEKDAESEAYYAKQELDFAYKKYEAEKKILEADKKIREEKDKEDAENVAGVAQDIADQDFKDRHAALQKKEDDAKAARKDARDNAKQAAGDQPGLKEDLQTELLKRQMGGQNNRQAQAELSGEIAAKLRESGVSGADAAALAKEQVGNANKSLMEDLNKPQQAKNSEVLGAGASFAEKIQSSISSDNTQKSQLEQLKELVRLARSGRQPIPTFQ
jgi:hypothetical protein